MSKFNEWEGEGECGCVDQVERLPVATSIDTLWLLFEDVVMAPDFAPYANNYKITKSTAKKGRKVRQSMLWREGSEPVWGCRAVAKSGCFDFCLERINPCKPPKLTVKFSFPRSKWGHNALPVTQDDVAKVIKDINTRAAKLGLSVDAERGKVTRLDLFRDVMVEHTFDDYLEVLRAVEPPHCYLFEERETWILRGTVPTRWAIYDKCAAIVCQSDDQDDEEARKAGWLGLAACRQKLEQAGGVGVMRFEWRLLTAEKIREQIRSDDFCFDDFGSLSGAGALLHKKFDFALERDVFRVPLPAEWAVESWCKLQEMRDQAPTQAHHLLLGPAKLETMLALDVWNRWVKRFGMKRAKEILKSVGSASEHRLFKEHLCQAQQSMLMDCGLFWGELYSELAHAVFSPEKLEKLPRLPMPYVPPEPKVKGRKKQA